MVRGKQIGLAEEIRFYSVQKKIDLWMVIIDFVALRTRIVEEMNLEEKRFELFSLKAEQARLILIKNELIKNQQYEKVVEIRDEEKTIAQQVHQLKNEAAMHFKSLGDSRSAIQEKQELLKYLIEIDPFDHPFLDPIDEILRQDKIRYREQKNQIQMALDEALQKRDELILKNDFQGLTVLDAQILELERSLNANLND